MELRWEIGIPAQREAAVHMLTQKLRCKGNFSPENLGIYRFGGIALEPKLGLQHLSLGCRHLDNYCGWDPQRYLERASSFSSHLSYSGVIGE